MTSAVKEPIQVIGLDCDDPYALEKLLRRNDNILKQADIICGSRAILERMRHNPELSGRLLQLTPPLDPLFESILGLRDQGLKVVILADGDPLFYGIGASLSRRLKGEGLIIKPGICTIQAVSRRLNLPWDKVQFVSMHGREDLVPLYSAVLTGNPVCILTGGRETPNSLARILFDRGIDWYEVHIFERMGRPDEKQLKLSMRECQAAFFGNNVTMMLIPIKKPRPVKLGLDERRYRGAYATKRPVRGAIFELLQIEPHHCVWDVGAGSGILGLEACTLAHSGRVIAIEKNKDRCLDIQENRRILGAANLEICSERAPDCLASLQTPQRIIVGGGLSSNNGAILLEKCIQSLPRGGRLVASCVLLDSFMICRKMMEDLRWPLEMQQIQASNVTMLGPGKHFSPINPVFLLATQKP